MSDGSSNHDLWPPAQARQLDCLCDQFERAWQSAGPDSPRPRIEDYLDQVPEAERAELLRELLALERDYRKQSGDRVAVEDYHARFSGQADILAEVFRETSPRITPRVDGDAAHDFDPLRTGPYVGTGEAEPIPDPERMPDDRLPQIPGYEVMRKLGEGGMGVVYQARQLSLKRLVALKMIKTGPLSGPTELTRFRAEAEAIARLQHPNIVQIYEVGEQDGWRYLSLEYVTGGGLNQRLAGAPQPAVESARLVETLARAIQHAHQHGIIHRDLKPANVLLHIEKQGPTVPVPSPVLKIADFGLAKQLDTDGQTLTGDIIGTPSYMAPEQAAGEVKQLGPAVDIYALGAILYEMLTGRPPFKGASMADTLELVRHTEPVPPRRLQPKAPRDLETICLTCLRKAAGRRYATAGALADDLGRFLKGEPIHARPTPLWERTVKWVQRRPALAAFYAACTAIVLIGVAALVIHQQHRIETAQRELQDYQRLGGLRRQGQADLDQGLAALARNDLPTAKVHLEKALTIGRQHGELEELAQSAGTALVNHTGLVRFTQLHDLALFHETLFTGLDIAANRTRTRAAAREALALFGVTSTARRGPVLERTLYNPDQQAFIHTACHELLLIWAEAVAQPLPGTAEEPAQQAQQALDLLELANRLNWSGQPGFPAKAYLLRRARYVKQRGDAEAADRILGQSRGLEPASAVDHFLIALEGLRQGDPADAIRACRAVQQIQPSHFWAQYLKALGYVRLKRWEAAEVGLSDCLSQRPEFLWPYLLRGFVYGELGDYPAAETDFARALALHPDEVGRYGIHVNRGVLCLRRGRLDEAVAEFQQAIALRPGQYQAYVNLAQAYQGQKKLPEAVAQLNRAIELVEQQGQSGSPLAALYRTRARLQLLRPDEAAALRDLEQAIASEPPGSKALVLAEDHVERGRLLQRRQQFGDALQAYAAALKVRPDLALAHRLRAEVLLEQEQPQEALQALDQYLAQGKPQPQVLRARGLIRAKLGDQRGAVDDYSRSLELQPDRDTLLYRGWAYLASDASKLALADFETALRLAPANAEAHAGRGCARARLGQYPQAVADAEAALRHGPPTPRLVYNASRIYALAASQLEAETHRRDRPSPALRYQYQDRAVKLLRQALDLLPKAQRAAFWRDISPDPALLPLRRHAGFAQLEAEYPRPAKEPR